MREQINDILVYIREHLDSIERIEQVASVFGYSKFHFSREFKKVTGFSFAQE